MNNLLVSTDRIQLISVVGSLLMLLFVVRLIKRRRFKEEYALLWIVVFSIFTVISFFTPILNLLAHTAGILYAPSALLLVLTIGIFLILIHYSLVITRLDEQNKTLVQEVALLKQKLGIPFEQELS